MNNNIYPCLWCENNAQEIASFYQEVFSATIVSESNTIIRLNIFEQSLMLLNGGQGIPKSAAQALIVNCTSEEELQNYWSRLSVEGIELMPIDSYPFADQYGWLRDKYGVTWHLKFSKANPAGQKLAPSLVFVNSNNGKAIKAMHFYATIFPESKVTQMVKYKDGIGGDVPNHLQNGTVFLDGIELSFMDSSLPHQLNYNEAFSIVVMTDTQEQTDLYWNSLLRNGGTENQCGWLRDQYGLSWQIVPKQLVQYIGDQQNPEKAQNALNAMLQMKKLDINLLAQAYNA